MGSDTKALTISSSPPPPSLLLKNVEEITLFDHCYNLFSFSLFQSLYRQSAKTSRQSLAMPRICAFFKGLFRLHATWRDLWKMRSYVLWTEHVQWACKQHLAKCKRLTKWPSNQCSCKTYCHRSLTRTCQRCHSIQQSCIIRYHLYKRTLCAFFYLLTLSSNHSKSAENNVYQVLQSVCFCLCLTI